MINEIIKDFEFLKEIDKMKNVIRKVKNINNDNYEDDAQHTFHISIMSTVLYKYIEIELDLKKVIEMLLFHDLVEIYAGDTFAYDNEGYKTKKIREELAANKIFGIMSEDNNKKFRSYFEEFEDMKTNEALYANFIDRIQPMLLNHYNNGGTWKLHNIKKEQVKNRIEFAKDKFPKLYSHMVNLIDETYLDNNLC